MLKGKRKFCCYYQTMSSSLRHSLSSSSVHFMMKIVYVRYLKINILDYACFNLIFFSFIDFVLTRATNGDLLSYLEKSVKFELEVARFYLAELIHAVEHMHTLGVIHRDLKPENILLTNNRHILITDFGSSKILPKPPLVPGTSFWYMINTFNMQNYWFNKGGDQSQGTNPRRGSFVGSPPFVSPEMLNEKESSPASDLWAIGCILYQMIEGNPPFQAR